MFHFDPQKQLGEDRPKLVFKVADIEAAHQVLSKQVVEFSQINSRSGNIQVADGCDPEGNPFSIYTQAGDHKVVMATNHLTPDSFLSKLQFSNWTRFSSITVIIWYCGMFH